MLLLCGVCLMPSVVLAQERVLSARLWPATEYSRLTIETRSAVQFRMFTVDAPDRVVIDLDAVELGEALKALPSRLAADDPHIKSVRVAQFKPGVVRVVLDVKQEVRPQIFALPPVGEYGHRLVLDVYPVNPSDPLLALLVKPDGEVEELGRNGAASPLPGAQATKPDAGDAGGAATKSTGSDRDARGAQPEMMRLITVAIDAGHGGEDPGARGRRGTLEKDVTLAIAKRLKALMDQEEGFRGILVRDADYFVPLQQRVGKARRVRADLFVSVHADAFVRPDARGSSVYALSERGATSVAAGWLAKRENEADLIGGVNLDVKDPYLAQTLLDLSQTATISDSLKLGRAVLAELGSINHLHKQDVEQAGFAVLKAPDIPSILVETAFISNPKEELRLKDDDYQDKMARSILAGIKRYMALNPPLTRTRVANSAF